MPALARAPAAGDQRLGEAWTTRQRWKNNLIYHVSMGMVVGLSRLPLPALWRLGRLLGVVVWAVSPSLRSRIEAGLKRAHPLAPASSCEVLSGLGAVLLDTVGLTRDGPFAALSLDAASRAVLAAAVAEGRGVVFATAHLGGWERMAATLAEAGFPIATVARESYDPRFHRLYDRTRKQKGVQVLYRGASGFGASVVRTLRRGSVLGFPMDLAGRGVRTARVPFLGTERALPLGPATLALRTGAVLVVGTPTLPVDRGGRIRIERVPATGTAEELTAVLGRVLAERIEGLPTEWPWMLVAEDTASPLQSPDQGPISCATISTPSSPPSIHGATSGSCR